MSKVVHKGNNTFIEINNRLFSPLAFRSFRPVPANIALFHRAGIRLYQILVSGKNNAFGIPYSLFGEVWKDDGVYDFEPIDKQLGMFMEFAPDGYFCIMIQLDTPDWYLEKHPGTKDSFKRLGDAVLCEKWRKDAAEYLKAVITYCEEKYGDRIYAYAFSCGYATEWFSNDLGSGSDEKLQDYREKQKSFSLEIPTYEELNEGDMSLRSMDEQRYKYLEYCSGFTPELVSYMAQSAQEVLNHKKLTGVFFGYFTVSSAKVQNLWLTNGYESVWKDDNIDMIFSPALYGYSRTLEGASGYQVAVDSLQLNNKLYLHEIDHRTNLAKYPIESMEILKDCYDTEFETIQVLRRELCAALTKHGAIWWFDFFGSYYSSPAYEAEIKREIEIYNELNSKSFDGVSEIAVFVDPMAHFTMKEECDLIKGGVRSVVEQIYKCGAPVSVYNFNDLTQIDASKYKLFIFLNATHIKKSRTDYIKNNLSDKYKFFIYAPGCICKDGFDFSAISDLCNMEITAVQKREHREITYKDMTFGYDGEVMPHFEVTDKAAEKLGFYQNGACGLAYKDKTFYCGAGRIPFNVFTDAAKRAGVHLYYENGAAIYAATEFIAVSTTYEENVAVKLPYDCTLVEMFEDKKYKTENKVLRYTAPKGTTRLFKIVDRF